MKTIARIAVVLTVLFGSRLIAAVAAHAGSAQVASSLTPSGGRITVEAHGIQPVVPVVFTARAEQSVRVLAHEITSEAKVALSVIQGRPEVLSLRLSGDGEIVSVAGPAVRDWSVRRETGGESNKRFLDIRPALPEKEGPFRIDLLVQTRRPDPLIPGKAALLLLGAGDAAAFEWQVRIEPDAAVELRVEPLQRGRIVASTTANATRAVEVVGTGDAHLEIGLARRGADPTGAEIAQAQLAGRVHEGAVVFQFKAQARAERAGSRHRLLSGGAALSAKAAGEGWHIERAAGGGSPGYDLVLDRKGIVPVDLELVARIQEDGDWRRLDFALLAGAVVPISIEDIGGSVEFDRAAAVVMAAMENGGRGFVPADGRVALGWKRTREKSDGALFFTSTELSEVRVAAGLLKQSSQLTFRVMQGKLPAVRLRLDGPGEIVGVDAANLLGWRVIEAGETRVVEVQFSRPVETEGLLTVQSQQVLGGFPVSAEPLRITPESGVRHSGFMRVAGSGAVRLEVTDVQGVLQLSPAQYPGTQIEAETRQVFVYRFPTSERRLVIQASPILPEVGVSQISTYELGESDRVITSDLELDIREAPLRDWAIAIPSDFTVVAVQGATVADYVVEAAVTNGLRVLKIAFSRPVSGRQLLSLRLERNEPPSAGEWKLPALDFPGAKSVRGHIGVVGAAGYRIVPGSMSNVTDVPLSLYPKQTAGLQQAFRLRDPVWSATLRVEALGHSVQADVFHLYSVREGTVAASVLLNYFVVGAPAHEWRIEVPESAGNIDVTGQGVRRDWRREGNLVIVSLHQPVLGSSTLLVTFELPLSARGGVIHPGEVKPLGVQSERGYVQVASPLQVKADVRRTEGGPVRLEPLELPAELRLLTTTPSLAVYQYTARPFAIEMAVERYASTDTVGQVVDFADYRTQIARDGQVVTEMRLFVKTRGRTSLRLQLPAGAMLWETRVDNELVTARADGASTLVPLAPRMNPNEPVLVTLRLGQPAVGLGRSIELLSPRMAITTVVGEWTVRGDAGRQLVARGGNAELTRPNLTQSGFEWIADAAPWTTATLLLLIVLCALVIRVGGLSGGIVSVIAGAGSVAYALALAADALTHGRPSVAVLNYSSTVLPAGDAISLQIGNIPAWQASLSVWGLAALAAGIVCAWYSRRTASRSPVLATLLPVAAAILIGVGLLAQRGGAVWFFVAMALEVAWLLLIPSLSVLAVAWRGRKGGAATGAAGAVVPSIALLFAIGSSVLPSSARAESAPPASTISATAVSSLVQRWDIREGRLYGQIEVSLRGAVGDSFVLLRAPAVLSHFAGDGLRVNKVESAEGGLYYVTPERAGMLTAVARFELSVGDLSKGLPILTGPAAVQRVSVQLDQPGWEFVSSAAIQVQTMQELAPDRSGAHLVLAGEGTRVINLVPRRRDLGTEPTRFFAEVANLYVPGPGVVNAFARVAIRPVQGRVSSLELRIPEGFSVGDVGRGPVGTWRFDPKRRLLRVAIEPARADAFSFVVETQRAAGALPFDVTLTPIRVLAATGDVGTMALGFGGDAQPEAIQPTALSVITSDDFDGDLVPRGTDKAPLAAVQRTFRYSGSDAALSLRVASVTAELRVTCRQLLSLGDDRVVVTADVAASITRVGVFQLSFLLPDGLELEAVSGRALSHWTETKDGVTRVVTLHLNGRTLGDQSFAITLAGAFPRGTARWAVPQIRIREATRQGGELQVVPERGIQLRAVERRNVSELDPRAVGNPRAGALAFRVLQEDWALVLAVDALAPWITAQALQEVTIREGQTMNRLAVRYRIENAAINRLRVRLPGLTTEQGSTVRATGPAVSDILRISEQPDVWEVRFQRKVIGETSVVIEYQGASVRDEGVQRVTTPVLDGARQVTQYVVVRGSGRLEFDVASAPRGWNQADWSGVPVLLQDRSDRSVPAFVFRVAEPEAPLAIAVRSHRAADALKLRVTGGELTTTFSARGDTLTVAELQVDVSEKATLRVALPPGAQLFATFVNGETVQAVREGDAHLFHVSAATAGRRDAMVRLVYSGAPRQPGDITLVGPRLNVPLENVTWKVLVPPGYRVASYKGGLRLRSESGEQTFGVGEYETLVVSRRAADSRLASDYLQTANTLLRSGQQQAAGEVLARAAKTPGLDDAMNEDARVQLRSLRTQQAVVGLNTRRQKLYLDNSADTRRNEQLEQAANLNPLMRGKLEFDPAQLDQLLMGNSVEENTALRGIAGKIVDQQLGGEAAPGVIDVTLPVRGRVLTFTRSLQVKGDSPLELRFELQRTAVVRWWFLLLLPGAVGVVLGVAVSTRANLRVAISERNLVR